MSPLTHSLVFLVALAVITTANPLIKKDKLAARADYWGSWTQGPECQTNSVITSALSRITNPPATATSYTPSKFCSDFLQQTSISYIYATSTGVRTNTDHTVIHYLVTVTDTAHPTSTKYCAIPSPGMVCGISNPNIIAPGDQQEDWNIEHNMNPEECQQTCLSRPLCKAYRVVPVDSSVWNCEIFNLGLGVNGSNVISASKGDQWWDRNCPNHLPTECNVGSTPTPTDIATSTQNFAPLVTPGPTLIQRDGPLAKRAATIPAYLSDYNNVWSSYFLLSPACSCLITSASPGLLLTSTSTVPSYTATEVVTSTYEDWFTVTVTPRSTTVFPSIS